MRRFEVIALFALVVGGGCSLLTTDQRACTETSECQNGFGVGWFCGKAGYCEQADVTSRCSRTFPANLTDDPSKDDRIIIGTLADHSVESHIARERAVELAVRQINQAGGADGREFGLVSCDVGEGADGLSTVEAAETSARYLAQIGVPAVIGPMSSEETAKVFDALAADDVLIISPSATASDLTALEPEPSDGSPGRLWRTTSRESHLAEAMAYDLGVARNVQETAVIYDAGVEGTALFDDFSAMYPGAMDALEFEGTGYNAHAVTVAETELTDVVFLATEPAQILDFLRTANGLDGFVGNDPKNVYVTEAGTSEEVLSANLQILARLRGVRFAPPDINNPVFRTFKTAFQAQYGDDPSRHAYVANAYDAAWMVALGIGGALTNKEVVTGSGIARRLRQMSAGTDVGFGPSGWSAGLELGRQNAGMNVQGASGDLTYGADEETTARIQYFTLVRENNAWAARGTSFYIAP